MPAGKYVECQECSLLLGRPQARHVCDRSKTIKRLKERIYELSDHLVKRDLMSEQVKLEFGPDGVIRTMYKDGLEKVAKIIDAEMTTTCRAAHVEWEEIKGLGGWTIRAVHDPELAVRDAGSSEPVLIVSTDPELRVALFTRREAAIEVEKHNFFKLLPPKEQRTE